MKLQSIIDKPFLRNTLKLTAAVLLSAAVLVGGLALWDCWDFAHRKGRAVSKEAAGEKALWKFVADDYAYTHKFDQTRSVGFINKNGDLLTKKKEIAGLKKWAADRMRRLRYQDLCLEKLPNVLPNNDHLYLQDLRLLQELEVRFSHIAVLFSEISVNSEQYFLRSFNAELCDEFYKVYDREKHIRRFSIPGKVVLGGELRNVGGAAALQTYRCGVQHGCFNLYQGASKASLRREFAEMPESMLAMYSKEAVYEANYGCLFKRIHNGSKTAAIYRWLKLPRILFYNLSRCQEIINLAKNNHDFLDAPANPYVRFAPMPEDDTWYDAQYLALTIDNFLWTIKYNVDHREKPSALVKYRIRPLYSKNSPEMEHYAKFFIFYSQYHYIYTQGTLNILGKERGKLEIDEEYDTDMKKALIDLSREAKDISDTWKRYCADKSDFKTFAAELRKNETDFEKVRQKILRMRWRDIHEWAQRSGNADADLFADGFTLSSMAYDGVSYEALERLVKDKQKQL